MVGYIMIRAQGFPRADSLWGDYFVVNPSENFAQGETLIDLADDCRGACKRHALRYLDGGAFDGGTQIMIWTAGGTQPSENPYFPEGNMVQAETAVFDMDGESIDDRSRGFLPVEVIDVADLGLSSPFGWLEIATDKKSFISVRYDALDRFSVGLRSFCLRNPDGQSIRIEKYTNGFGADLPPGPSIPVGDPVLWEYSVSNNGDQDLYDVRVTDDQGVSVSCPRTSLEIGESMTCTANGFAVAGQYRNLGTVKGYTIDGSEVVDDDPSHYWGVGSLAARRQSGLLDRGLSTVASFQLSLPVFVVGTLMILLFAQTLRWVPAGGHVAFLEAPLRPLVHLALPATAIAVGLSAVIYRMARVSVIETQEQDWVRTARSKGPPEGVILRRHVVRNALGPVLTVVGLNVGTLLGGTVLIEYVFNWPGLSGFLVSAVEQRDYPAVQGIVLVISFLFILINLCVDLLYSILDPRIGHK